MAVANLPGDCRQWDPVLALHVDDTLVGFCGRQRLDREVSLGMLGLGHLVQGCEGFQARPCLDGLYHKAHPSCPPALARPSSPLPLAYFTLFSLNVREKNAPPSRMHGARPSCWQAMQHQHMTSASRKITDKPRQDILSTSVHLGDFST